MLCGRMGASDTPMAVVGGNCSIQGFDMNGEELYWTVTGDNVNAMALADVNGDVFLDSSLGSEGEGEGSGSDRYRSAPPPLPPRAGTSGLSGACAFVALDVDGVGDDANFSPRAKNEDGGLNGDGVGRCKLNSVYP